MLHNKTPHILIADDDQPSLVLLEILTQSLGYRTTLVIEGTQVMDKVKESRPDLILLDMHLPGIDGLAVCEMLKQNRDLSDIPIIFITADADLVKKNEAFHVGCTDYIVKPINVAEVKSRIQDQLTK